jgi:hypothetical protein
MINNNKLELLSLKNLIAITMADIDIFLLQNEEQTADLDQMYDKYQIRKQLHKSAQKIIDVLSDYGYNIDKPLYADKLIFNN